MEVGRGGAWWPWVNHPEVPDAPIPTRALIKQTYSQLHPEAVDQNLQGKVLSDKGLHDSYHRAG